VLLKDDLFEFGRRDLDLSEVRLALETAGGG
jgi:hypothetical protein